VGRILVVLNLRDWRNALVFVSLCAALAGCGGDGTPETEAAADTDRPRATDSGEVADTAVPTDVGVAADADEADDEPSDAEPELFVRDTGAVRRDTRDDDEDFCGEVTSSAAPTTTAIDLIIAVDTSGSMNEETRELQNNLNDLASFVTDSGVDAQVLMVGYAASICPRAPLTDGACPPGETESYKPIDVVVASNDALDVLLRNYDSGGRYSTYLREGGIRHVLIVTDDNSYLRSDEFLARAVDLASPGLIEDTFYHAIVSTGPDPIGTNLPCRGPNGVAVVEGTEYRELVLESGGVEASICDANWGDILDEIADSIVESSVTPCTYDVPLPEERGARIEPATIRVEYTANGATSPVPRVASASDCGAGGWFFENDERQDTIVLCPASCDPAIDTVRVTGECRKR
jgi:hypothetical protein